MKITTLDEFLQKYIDYPGLTHAVESFGLPNEENFWQWRQFYRLYDEEIQKPTFALIPELDNTHQAFIKPSDPVLLRYFPDTDKAKRDVPVTIKMGKYLTRFYSEHYNAEEIKEFVAEHMYNVSPAELLFVPINDHDLAERIYEEGPKSCMVRERNHIRSNLHPCRAYPTEDIGLAYIKKGDRITARCVYNRNTKHYARIYGDTAMMLPLLQEQDFHEHPDALHNCRIHRIEDDHTNSDNTIRYLMPYVDGGAQAVRTIPDNPDRFLLYKPELTYSGEGLFVGTATNPAGYINIDDPSREECGYCEEYFPTEDLLDAVANTRVCPDCAERFYMPAMTRGSRIELSPIRSVVHTVDGIAFASTTAANTHGYVRAYELPLFVRRDYCIPSDEENNNLHVLRSRAISVYNAETTTRQYYDYTTVATELHHQPLNLKVYIDPIQAIDAERPRYAVTSSVPLSHPYQQMMPLATELAEIWRTNHADRPRLALAQFVEEYLQVNRNVRTTYTLTDPLIIAINTVLDAYDSAFTPIVRVEEPLMETA